MARPRRRREHARGHDRQRHDSARSLRVARPWSRAGRERGFPRAASSTGPPAMTDGRAALLDLGARAGVVADHRDRAVAIGSAAARPRGSAAARRPGPRSWWPGLDAQGCWRPAARPAPARRADRRWIIPIRIRRAASSMRDCGIVAGRHARPVSGRRGCRSGSCRRPRWPPAAVSRTASDRVGLHEPAQAPALEDAERLRVLARRRAVDAVVGAHHRRGCALAGPPP